MCACMVGGKCLICKYAMSFYCHKKERANFVIFLSQNPIHLFNSCLFIMQVDVQKNRHLFVTHVLQGLHKERPILCTLWVQKIGLDVQLNGNRVSNFEGAGVFYSGCCSENVTFTSLTRTNFYFGGTLYLGKLLF